MGNINQIGQQSVQAHLSQFPAMNASTMVPFPSMYQTFVPHMNSTQFSQNPMSQVQNLSPQMSSMPVPQRATVHQNSSIPIQPTSSSVSSYIPQLYYTVPGSIPQMNSSWLFDSGATNHITNNLSNLTLQQPYTETEGVLVGNGTHLPITHTGQGTLSTPSGQFQLKNMLHVPQISHNLLSVYQLTRDNNCRIIFDANGFVIQDKTTNKTILQGPCVKGLYAMEHYFRVQPQALLSTDANGVIWHQRLGHPNSNLMHSLIKQFQLPIHGSLNFNCNACNVAKSHKLPFSESHSHTSKPFQLLHMDVWGPAPIPSFQGFRYYLLILDDYTKYIWLFPMRYKSEVQKYVTSFKAFVST